MRKYQDLIDALFSERKWQYWSPLSIIGRLYEEMGELAREINHHYGDKKKRAEEAKGDIEEEIGDVLYTLICLANREKCDLSWVSYTCDSKSFKDAYVLSVFAQVGKQVGHLTGHVEWQYGSGIEKGANLEGLIETAIGHVIQALARLAHQCGCTLDSAIQKSVDKVAVRDKDRFPDGK